MPDKAFDIVVIGSGAGGGTVAPELAPLCRDGLQIAVLEWGPRLKEEEYTGREVEIAVAALQAPRRSALGRFGIEALAARAPAAAA